MEPIWLVEARRHLGLREIPGKGHNKQILKWWSAIRAPFTDDETPWCAGFVGGCFEAVGMKSSRSAAARSYMKWGSKLDGPALGCVVVFWRGRPDGWSGHVAFVVGETKSGHLMCLGGNQSNAVTVAPFDKQRVLGYRWPLGPTVPSFNLPVLRSDGVLSDDEA